MRPQAGGIFSTSRARGAPNGGRGRPRSPGPGTALSAPEAWVRSASQTYHLERKGGAERAIGAAGPFEKICRMVHTSPNNIFQAGVAWGEAVQGLLLVFVEEKLALGGGPTAGSEVHRAGIGVERFGVSQIPAGVEEGLPFGIAEVDFHGAGIVKEGLAVPAAVQEDGCLQPMAEVPAGVGLEGRDQAGVDDMQFFWVLGLLSDRGFLDRELEDQKGVFQVAEVFEKGVFET